MRNKIIDLTDSDIVLTLDGSRVDEADVDRFGTVFLKVWASLSRADKQFVSNYWKSDRYLHPIIELQETWTGVPTAIASTESSGAVIKFNWSTCKQLPDGILAIVAAHEMGHVHHFAHGKNRSNMSIDDLPTSIELLPLPLVKNALVELYADQMAKRWGWDPVLKDAYYRQYFDLKDGKSVRRAKPRDKKRAYNYAAHQRRMSSYDIWKKGDDVTQR